MVVRRWDRIFLRHSRQINAEPARCSAANEGRKASMCVNRVVSSVLLRLPLLTQVQTYRCIALNVARDQERKSQSDSITLPGASVEGPSAAVLINRDCVRPGRCCCTDLRSTAVRSMSH